LHPQYPQVLSGTFIAMYLLNRTRMLSCIQWSSY
jgi:hypothetical protein